jgi:transcriptional regulator with XRE-family HTH domain
MAVNITPSGASGVPLADLSETLERRIERAPPGGSEPDLSHCSDAQRVRELLRRAGLSLQAAARELEIDERAMRGYCTGRRVPRYLLLAIERLADLGRTKVYHITTTESAVDILARGFRVDSGTDMTASLHGGVWVADRLLVHLSDINLDDMACFEIGVSKTWLARYESLEEGKAYRRFLVPATELNEFPRRRLPDKEWLSMPWGR